MKHIKLCIVTAIFCVVLACFCASTDAAIKYEMVRQGSVGETVQRVQIRLQELDFLHFKPTGAFRSMTVSATIAFQKLQTNDDGGWVAADGEAGEQTQSILFSTRARRATIAANANMPIGPALSGTPKYKGMLMSWDKVQEKMTENKSYKVFDYNTGKSFFVRYIGGEYHAEVECVTKDDTKVFLEVFGGEYNYSKRAMVVQLDSDTLVAASMFGYPHGEDTIANNDMTGHICLFFDSSKAHVGNITDVEHQKQIYVAAGM